MFEDDVLYYTRRAEAELELAQNATVPQAVRAHYQLAEAYLDRVASSSDARVAEAA